MIRTDDLRRHGLVGTHGYGNDESAKFFSKRGSKIAVDSEKSTNSHELRGLDVRTAAPNSQLCHNNPVFVEASRDVRTADWDHESQTSQSRLVKQTRTWDVDREPKDYDPKTSTVSAWTLKPTGKSSDQVW